MSQKEPPPPISERLNVPLKIVSVAVGYLIYRVLLGDDERIAGPMFVAVGFIALAYAMVNRWTAWRRERSGLLQVGTTILGLGLMGLGAILMLTR
jgi:hypothetical protein